ncbi:MAG: hypothetical protein MMC23_008583 [Stictis urceolatum]|nr:hypothetical protein [Stictis urceolata]
MPSFRYVPRDAFVRSALLWGYPALVLIIEQMLGLFQNRALSFVALIFEIWFAGSALDMLFGLNNGRRM